MKKKLLKIPAAVEFDAKCAEFQQAEATRDRLWKELYALARRNGVALKDAPRSRLLAGVEFEALASLATRTEVDQRRAAKAVLRSDFSFRNLISPELWYALNPQWERELAALPLSPRGRATVRARVLACLRTRPVKRLTIRKRKSEVRTQKSERRIRRAA